MLNWKSKLAAPAMVLTAGILLPELALAQDAAEDEAAAPGFDEIGPYIMTTLLFLVGGFLVFWMAAGFAMLEAGLVRSKNVTMQLTKNIALFSIAAIMYWLVGFSLMYPGGFTGYFARTSFRPSWSPWASRRLMRRSTMLRLHRTSSSS